MNKKLISILLLVIVTALITYFTLKKESPEAVVNKNIIEKSSTSFDGKNTNFTIDRQLITLVNGIAEKEATPGSASKITTKYFGNSITGDLTGDGLPDTAFLVTQSTGGTGLFYYAVVAIKTENGYKNTNAFLIGDRIAPQPMYIPIGARELHVNFAQRRAGEPMTAQPSEGATTLLKVTPEGVLEGLMK